MTQDLWTRPGPQPENQIAGTAADQYERARLTDTSATTYVPLSVTNMTYEELMSQQFKPLLWVVQDIIPEGLTILAGSPKVGKSWLTLSLALAVASGGCALDAKEVRRGAVLYLALEDGFRRLQRRLKRLLQHMPQPTEELLFCDHWPRADEGGLAQIEGWLQTHGGARLIIVDTLARFRPLTGATGGAYQDDYQAGAGLQELAQRFGVGVVLVHHDRKLAAADFLGSVSGTHGLTGAADTILVLKRTRGQDAGSLFVTGREIEDDGEKVMRWEKDRCQWTLVDQAVPEAQPRPAPTQEKVLQAFQGQELTPAALTKKVGMSRDHVKMVLGALLKQGRVVRVTKGVYRAALA